MFWSCPPGVLALGPPERCRPRELPHVPCPGPPGMSYRTICRWLLLVLGLEMPKRGQAGNLGRLLLLTDLQPRIYRGQVLLIWEILEKSTAWTKSGHFYGKQTNKHWKWLCGPESWVGWGLRESPVPCRQCEPGWQRLDMGPVYWLCERRSHQRNNGLLSVILSGRNAPPALALIPNNSVPSHICLLPFKWRAVKGLVINAVGVISMFYQLMDREGDIVGLSHSVGHFGWRYHTEGVHDVVRIPFMDLANEQGTHSRACALVQWVG